MAVTEQDVRNFISGGDSIPSSTIVLYLNLAPSFMEKYEVLPSDSNYDTFHLLYVTHLLYVNGHAVQLAAFSIDGHSQTHVTPEAVGPGKSQALLLFESMLDDGGEGFLEP